jgi:hypothetical protein
VIKVQDNQQLNHRQVRDGSGRRLGRVRAISCQHTDRYAAEWALVDLGRFRAGTRLVPLHSAQLRTDGRIYVPYSKGLVVGMPPAKEDDLTDDRARAASIGWYGI